MDIPPGSFQGIFAGHVEGGHGHFGARLERRATTKNMETRTCVIDILSCFYHTRAPYQDLVSP